MYNAFDNTTDLIAIQVAILIVSILFMICNSYSSSYI